MEGKLVSMRCLQGTCDFDSRCTHVLTALILHPIIFAVNHYSASVIFMPEISREVFKHARYHCRRVYPVSSYNLILFSGLFHIWLILRIVISRIEIYKN